MNADCSVRSEGSVRGARRFVSKAVEQEKTILEAFRVLSANAHGTVRVRPRFPRYLLPFLSPDTAEDADERGLFREERKLRTRCPEIRHECC